MEYWTAFILGLVGSVHCAGMCGPLAIALPGAGGAAWSFVPGRIVYNTGRLITYCGLGSVFGVLGHTVVLSGVQRWVSIALGVLLLAGLIVSRHFVLWNPVTNLVQRLKGPFSALLRRRSLLASLALGILNGFLPCGLVYVACAAAVANGGVLAGVQYMAAFGAGTLPMMLGIGLSGRLVPLSYRLRLRKTVPASIVMLAALLILRGLSLGIPYLSPDLSGAAPGCCSH